MTAAWVVRAGRSGENEQWNIDNGCVSVGWPEIGDLTGCHTKDAVRALVDAAYPQDSPAQRANSTTQLWAFRQAIKPGDLVIMPLKTKRGYLLFGRCTGPFAYDPGNTNLKRRKTVPVAWQAQPVSKTLIKDDLVYSLNAISTVFSPSRNNAVARLEQVLKHGTDPGNNNPAGNPAATQTGGDTDDSTVIDPVSAPTIQAIRDSVSIHLVENFAGHKLTGLIADILRALGYVCEVSPAGPDGGVDILAGRGPLGMDSPTLVVEVKSEPTPISAPVVRGLHGAISRLHADQGLLVAWGGVTNAARREFERDRTTFRIWEANEVLDRLFATYDQLPASTRAMIPLTQAWVLDDERDG